MSRKIGAALMDMRRFAEASGMDVISSDDIATRGFSPTPRKSLTTVDLKPEAGVSASSAVRWRLTSVRWIDESPGARHYVRKLGEPMPRRLEASLHAMQYGLAEWSERISPDRIKAGKTFSATDYDAYIHKLVQNWSDYDHSDMVDFLRKGGYSARRDELVRSKLFGGSSEVMTIDGSDEELELVENGGVPSSSERSVSREGADDGSTVEEAVQYGNPWAGSW